MPLIIYIGLLIFFLIISTFMNKTGIIIPKYFALQKLVNCNT